MNVIVLDFSTGLHKIVIAAMVSICSRLEPCWSMQYVIVIIHIVFVKMFFLPVVVNENDGCKVVSVYSK